MGCTTGTPSQPREETEVVQNEIWDEPLETTVMYSSEESTLSRDKDGKHRDRIHDVRRSSRAATRQNFSKTMSKTKQPPMRAGPSRSGSLLCNSDDSDSPEKSDSAVFSDSSTKPDSDTGNCYSSEGSCVSVSKGVPVVTGERQRRERQVMLKNQRFRKEGICAVYVPIPPESVDWAATAA